ncbi:MAG: LysM peptidoglycan-binding domain-containing protein [Chloroflexi bacterium]|nr:LysM peptidoglycan-binding domain-containing protein [Chloroflexota bacterium]
MKHWRRQWLMAVVVVGGLLGSAPMAQAQSCASPYIVASGDSLWRIAQKCGTAYAALLAANPEITPELLRIGQQINLFGAPPAPTPRAAPAPAPSGAASASSVRGAHGLPRLMIANYMPWYDVTLWGQGATSDVPAIPYNSGDDSTVQRHIAQGRQAGLDGFAVHWFQPGDPTDQNFQKVLAYSGGQNFFSTVTFLRHILPGASKQSVVDALNYVRGYGGNGNVLKINGKMVIFFSDMSRVPLDGSPSAVEAWRAIRAQVDPNGDTVWIAEGLDPSYLSVFDGLYVYKIDHACCPGSYQKAGSWAQSVRQWEARTGRPKYWIGTIMPGWDDTRSVGRPDLRAPSPAFARSRDGGAYYQKTFNAVIGTSPDMIILHSFNEWIEGSQIEPSVTYGDFYLNLTAQLAARYKQ